ncbi:MAG: lysylphosphatidylglycerol synthase transmembrane domain-containing protein [Solirubrobacteraceae bacterium]
MLGVLASASLGRTVSAFFNAVGSFFANLAAVHWGTMLIGLVFFTLNLTLRSRAIFNSLRAAYPLARFQWRRVWGAYFAAVGLDNVVPARGGDVVKVFLTKSSIPDSAYATVTAAIYTEVPFDVVLGVIVLIFAFSQGVFPKPPAFAKLDAFDLSFLASNARLTLFLITLLAVATLFGFAVLSRRVRAFWERVRQGFTIMRDRRRYLHEVVAFQAAAWLCRAAGFWFFLDAFRVGASVRNVMLVFGVNAVAGAVPLTPGGAGVQQALLVTVFRRAAPTSVVAAYSVGQQIAITALTSGVGFIALATIFRFRSFKDVIRAGRADRKAETPANANATAGPPAPHARA